MKLWEWLIPRGSPGLKEEEKLTKANVRKGGGFFFFFFPLLHSYAPNNPKTFPRRFCTSVSLPPMENDGLSERGFPVQTVPMTAKIRPSSTLTPKTWLRVGTTPRRVAMPFREIYPWLARALSPGCWFSCYYLAMSASGGKRKKKKKENGGFSRLVDWYARESESEREERKKERKQTHTWTSLVAFFWRSPFMVSSQI